MGVKVCLAGTLDLPAPGTTPAPAPSWLYQVPNWPRYRVPPRVPQQLFITCAVVAPGCTKVLVPRGAGEAWRWGPVGGDHGVRAGGGAHLREV